MYLRVVLRDVNSGTESTVTCDLSGRRRAGRGIRTRVLWPMGWSVLGLPVGAQAQWSTPDGGRRAAEIRAILFQPEASGDYTI